MSKDSRYSHISVDSIDRKALSYLVEDDIRPDSRTHDAKASDVVQSIFMDSLRSVTDVNNIFKTLPHLWHPRKILVSAICSPGDLTQNHIIVENTLRTTDNTLSSKLMKDIRDLFVNDLKLNSEMHTWVDNAVIYGSHPILILPDSALDDIIVGSDNKLSLESQTDTWYRPRGIFAVPNKNASQSNERYVSFENISVGADRYTDKQLHTISISTKDKTNNRKEFNLPFSLTDNLDVLLKPIIDEHNMQVSLENIYGGNALKKRSGGKKGKYSPLTDQELSKAKTLKDVRKLKEKREKELQTGHYSDSKIKSKFFRKGKQGFKRMVTVPSNRASDENVNHPTLFHLPSASVINISVPGDPGDHQGHLILLGSNGYPIGSVNTMDFYNDINNAVSGWNDGMGGDDASSELLSMANITMHGSKSRITNEDIDKLTDLQSDLLESQIIERIREGLLGADVELHISEITKRVMLARTFKNQHTTVLYVPSEYLTYIAIDYNEYGVGKSILEDAKSTLAMLATLTVASVMGSVSSAIPGKTIDLQLDPDDKDPKKLVTFMVRNAMELLNRQFPLGLNSTLGIAEELQRASINVNVSGNPHYPEVRTDIRNNESAQYQPNMELIDRLTNDVNLQFSVTSEMVNGSDQPDFATTVVANNLLLTKTVISLQTKINDHLADFASKFVKNSGILIDRIYKVVEENKSEIPKEYKGDIDEFIEDFVESVSIRLPSVEVENIEHQIEQLNKHKEAVTEVSEILINEETFLIDGYTPEVINRILPIYRNAFINERMREYVRRHAILPELDIFVPGDDEDPANVIFNDLESHSKHVIKSFKGLSKILLDVFKDTKTDSINIGVNEHKAEDNRSSIEEKTNERVGDDEEVEDLGTDNDAGTEVDIDADSSEDDIDTAADSLDLDAGDGTSGEGGEEVTEGETPTEEKGEDEIDDETDNLSF